MSYFPEFTTFESLYNQGIAQYVAKEISSDLHTPISVMLKLLDHSEYQLLFESVQDGAVKGRYSVIALAPDVVFRSKGSRAEINHQFQQDANAFVVTQDSPFAALEQLLTASKVTLPDGVPPIVMGLFGFMGYDMVRLVEDLGDVNPDGLQMDDSIFFRPTITIVFDSVSDKALISSAIYPTSDRSAQMAYEEANARITFFLDALNEPVPSLDTNAIEEEVTFRSNTSRAEYHQMVSKAKEYIMAGDVFQVVPSQRFSAKFTLPPIALYRSLRQLNPSPYLFYMRLGNIYLVGSSPEILVRLVGEEITVRPIAGTRKRGKDAAEDRALEADLLSDKKELAEHLMLIDLGRNDVGRVAVKGSVQVTEEMGVEYYSHVMHIVSNVVGKIKPTLTALDAIKASLPVGTVSGAPKVRAMQIINELEKEKRSFYAGGVGYLSVTGDMDLCITLRTALIKDEHLYIQAGGGVVADSDPEAEYQESCNKAKALMKAAEMAKNFLK